MAPRAAAIASCNTASATKGMHPLGIHAAVLGRICPTQDVQLSTRALTWNGTFDILWHHLSHGLAVDCGGGNVSLLKGLESTCRKLPLTDKLFHPSLCAPQILLVREHVFMSSTKLQRCHFSFRSSGPSTDGASASVNPRTCRFTPRPQIQLAREVCLVVYVVQGATNRQLRPPSLQPQDGYASSPAVCGLRYHKGNTCWSC